MRHGLRTTRRPVDRTAVDAMVDVVSAMRIDEAFIFTSFHQSPLPLALLLRLAGVTTDRGDERSTFPARCSTCATG